jgi:hypothetical protein
MHEQLSFQDHEHRCEIILAHAFAFVRSRGYDLPSDNNSLAHQAEALHGLWHGVVNILSQRRHLAAVSVLTNNDGRTLHLSTRIGGLEDLLLSNDLRRGASLGGNCERGTGNLWQGSTSDLRRRSYLSSADDRTSKHIKGIRKNVQRSLRVVCVCGGSSEDRRGFEELVCGGRNEGGSAKRFLDPYLSSIVPNSLQFTSVYPPKLFCLGCKFR